MKHAYYLYGSTSLDGRTLRESLEAALEVHFERRNSDYRGGEYFRFQGSEGLLTIEANYTDEDGCPVEEDFSDHGTLLYASDPSSSVVPVLNELTGLDLLRIDESE
ncbi:hypothetical protein ACIP29_02520 [Streptomyces coelicoflavus]|uniref:hypothetical protein n=1 Tax=Streptomyces coelicoflavus TaxID=285562 RepID=UPI0024AE7087|nr:hypothetical protein [Streptomyces coelicoflavus]MDI6518190.1 hypothetical protein [Streptomyces coelicoflavus]